MLDVSQRDITTDCSVLNVFINGDVVWTYISSPVMMRPGNCTAPMEYNGMVRDVCKWLRFLCSGRPHPPSVQHSTSSTMC
jgi:hypothetical protein